MKCFSRQGMLLKRIVEEAWIESEAHKKNINETCRHAIRHYLILLCVLSDDDDDVEKKREKRKISIIINGSFYLHYVSMSAAAALLHFNSFLNDF